MEASVVSLSAPRTTASERAALAPWHIYAVLFASTSVVVGVLWDISWHTTIGRDTFWTPAHVAIYLGGVVAGIACGWLALKTSFAGSPEERAAAVRFWHFFRAPLGAWVCIWGAFAMLTSAPFDNWWHNAYGLDVQILSPPHTVLIIGIAAIQAGALLMTLAIQNRAIDERPQAYYRALAAYASGLLLLAAATVFSEYADRVLMHSSIFYKVACGVFPLFLVALARASKLRWPATTIAGIYTALKLAMVWILPLFPAEPKLGPIFQNVTHMVPPDFPLLLIVPAVAIDLILQRFGEGANDWLLGATLGATFFIAFLAAQWPFADFLMSKASQNWVFATNNYFYGLPPDTYAYRHQFLPEPASSRQFGYLIALGLSMLSARLGLWRGKLLSRVRR
jgi:hypothetical protein